MLTPAFKINPSTFPYVLRATFTISTHCSKTVISVFTAIELPPESLIIEQTLSSSGYLLAAQTTIAPEKESCLLNSSPIPELAPVTIKTLFFKSKSSNPVFRLF